MVAAGRELARDVLKEVHPDAQSIEQKIFNHFGNVNIEYNRHVRNLVEWLQVYKPRRKGFELWDDDTWRRYHKPSGKQHTEWIVETMPKEMKKLTNTLMKCVRCRENAVDFYLQQQGSADEPMTQFYNCTACGYEWRVRK